MEKVVGILIFDKVEVLDFCGPFEVFSVTRRISDTDPDASEGIFKPLLIAQTREPINTVGGMTVTPAHSIIDHPPLDILVIPGGVGTRALLRNKPVLNWIQTQSQLVELNTSVCTGALLFAKNEMLKGRAATTHWQALELLRRLSPETDVRADLNVVRDGNIFTSAGISAGIEMALRVVAHYMGEETARMTAKQMEYTFPETDKRKIVF